MEFETWWLLVIPVFFGLGWLASRIDTRHLIRQSARLPDAYFKGLNFLLNEQPDKAIDAFVDVVKLDPETIELHFALGNLFRRRGETDRAIRVHQSLVSRSDLLPAQREHALFELGLLSCSGREGSADLVSAHKWFNLAALRGNEEAKRYRLELSREMTKAQIAQAQRQAREWLARH